MSEIPSPSQPTLESLAIEIRKLQQSTENLKDRSETRPFRIRLLEFYKEAYLAELERKEKINERLTLNLAVLTVIANIVISILNNLPPFVPSVVFGALYVLLAFAVLAGGVALAFFFRALGFPQGFKYGYIPKTTGVYKFVKDAETYNASASQSDRINVEREFEDNLMIQYNGYASRNADNNHSKSQLIYLTFTWSIISAVLLLLSAPLFYIVRNFTRTPPQAVEITAPIRIEYVRPAH